MQASKPEIFDWSVFDELCRSRGWNQPIDRSRALNVHVGTVTRLESGERQPGLEFANKCREVFGMENYARLFPLPTREETSHADS